MTFTEACREAAAGNAMRRPGRAGVLRRSTRAEQEGNAKLHVYVEAAGTEVRDFDATPADKAATDWAPAKGAK